MKYDFEGKIALITGGGSGIGRAVALDLAKFGASVVVADLNGDAAQKVVDTITAAGGKAVAFACDVAKPEDMKTSVDLAVKTFGGLHLAFNNAGIAGPQGPIEDIEIVDYLKLIDINLNSVFFGLKYEIPVMRASGGGAIVNTSSILGLVGTDAAAPYVAAKHGVAGMTKAAALGCADKGIRINSVHPGYINTPLLSTVDDETMAGVVGLHPMGRLGTAEEVAQVVLFLLSDQAAFVTGSQYVVDGGYTAQ